MSHKSPHLRPDLSSYFVKARLWRALLNRHPYDFIDTYAVLHEYFGYNTFYVNLGCWRHGFATVEPGFQLAMELSAALRLSKGDRVIDVGSGLGQAAVDLCKVYDLDTVFGLNTNSRQVNFANALAQSEGLDQKIRHFVGDASHQLGQFINQQVTSILAMECAGHFRDPDSFLHAANKVLVPGGRIALSQNISTSRLSLKQRGLLYAAFGFVPASLETWVTRLQRAGFNGIRTRDLTDIVLIPGLTFALNRAKQQTSTVTPIVERYVKAQLSAALRSVSHGALKYYAIFAAV